MLHVVFDHGAANLVSGVAPLNKPTPVLSDDLVDFSSVGREVPIRFLDDFVTVAEPLGHDVQADPR